MTGDLSKLGMTHKRAEAIHSLAQAVLDKRVTFSTPTSLEEAIDSLIQLPGIGDWTAQYIAMRALSEPDAFPVISRPGRAVPSRNPRGDARPGTRVCPMPVAIRCPTAIDSGSSNANAKMVHSLSLLRLRSRRRRNAGFVDSMLLT